ncbi:MAG: protein translocase subunit SecD [Anaerovoracaceae bacterium]
MNKNKVNKVLAVVIAVVIVFGWLLMVKGIPGTDVKPLAKKINLGLDIKGGVYVVLEAQNVDKYSDKKLADLMEQTKTVVNNRVDQMGLANPNVSVEGKDRIRVELPGVTDANEAIEQIGKTAQLKFTMSDQTFVLDGKNVDDATSGQSNETGKGGYVVNLKFDSEGAKAFEQATEKAAQGNTPVTVTKDMCEDGSAVQSNQILIWLDNKVISHPKVDEVISGGKCEIYGNFSQDEASNLAALIRGGSLPLELQEIQSSSQTAQIGMNALHMSILAGIIALIIVFIMMIVFYRAMGAAADIALMLYLFLILGGMALIGSVLTLPGIAGLILTVGMAVDGNVIIFTRIKEEIVGGKSIRVATQAGYKRAMSSIIDSQVTTLIAAVILYQMGTSSVKGFAWTLMIGTICSIFTSTLITQIYLGLMADSRFWARNSFFAIKPDGRPAFEIKKQFKVIEHRKIYYTVSICIILAGMITLGVRGFNYGIDFTGGTMLQFDMGKHVSVAQIDDVMKRHHVNLEQMQVVFSGDHQEEAVIRTNESLNKNERQSIIDDFKDTFGISDNDVLASEHFGASVGKELKQNALKALALAAVGMLIYIRLRFRQWKFGSSALLAVLHDVLIMVSFYAIFGITVNNPFIAAILTVVGYSINDTIVIFDRVRENMRYLRRGNTMEILNTSINQTLSRSIMTSVTTLVVMIPLYVMTSDAIREFVLPLMVGVATGCLSSIFIASPLYYEMSRAGMKNRYARRRKPSRQIEGSTKNAPYADARRAKEEAREAERKNEETDGTLKPPVENERPHTAKEANKGQRKPSRRDRKKGK